MKTALIFFHGNLTDVTHIKHYAQSADLVIAADGGAAHALAAGSIPDVVIGDMDSLDAVTQLHLKTKNTQFIRYPREKDSTDSELAVSYAIDQGAEELIMFGLLGNRIDHMQANILYLAHLAHHVHVNIIEGDQEITFVHDSIEILGKKGDELSLIPLQQDAVGITTYGLQYRLDDKTLPFGSTRGVSNVFVEERISVSLKKGLLMVVHRTTH